MTKILFIIVDGIGDSGTKENNWKTLFQTIPTPNLDQLAATGVSGLMDSFEAGYACGSDTSHLNILGYPPTVNYKGRGAFETEGSGLSMKAGDIGFKCNFSYMDPETKIVQFRRVDRAFHHWGLELVSYLDNMKIPGYEEYSVNTMHATEHRLGLKISGPGLSNEITGTDPIHDNLRLLHCEATNPTPEAQKTAMLVVFL